VVAVRRRIRPPPAKRENRLIIDTDVLVYELRGNERARRTVAQNLPFGISVVSYLELVQGMRNRRELQALHRQLRRWSVNVIHIDTHISIRSMYYVEEFFLSHSMQLADALVAATAVETNETLLTANDKHYRHIPGIQIKIFVP